MKRLFKKCKANALKMSKIFLVLVIFATEVLSPMVVMVNAKELPKMEKGDVYNPLTNTASDSASVTIGQGDVSVVKTVKKTDVLGRYEVSFEVKGKNTVTNTPITKPLYVVIVLDRSGSMVCDKNGYSHVVNENAHYVAADGVGIACLDSYGNPSALIKDKWESAIDGAIEFSDSLVEKANTYVSLVTFSGTATEATDFRSNSDVVENQSIFAKSEFGHPQGSTNLKDAIAKAYKKLDTITTTDAQKYIVVIGDGEPTEGGDYFCNYNHTCSAKKQSTIAKNKGINIYSIGYGVDKNATAQEVLKYISSNTLVTSQNPTGYEKGTYTDNGYYLEATTSGIVNSFETIFDNINVSLAGTNASLKDNLGGKFTFTISDSNVTDNGRSYTYNIGDIKEEGTKFSFFIDIDQDSPTGLYDTNDGFTLSYTDANGISKELPCGTNPQVYWEQNTYPYEIRYYKDEITNVNDATTYLGNVKGQAAHNANINVSLTKYIPEGYVSLATNPTSLTVDKTKENIVDVLYVKRSDLSYTVRYYKDSVSENNKLGNDVVVGNQTFGSQVEASEINVNKEKPTGYQDGVIETEMPITITTGENVINVVYSKDTFSYTVKYFYEKVGYTTEEERFVENEELRSSYEALYGDEITTYEAQNKTGFSFYKVNPIKLVVSENEQANVINVYYVRNNYNFTIKHLYENLNGEYTENEDYRIEDETSFGSSINSEEQEKHEDDGYIFGNVDPENMIIDTENNEMNFYYDLRDDLSYTVRYYKDSVSESNKLGNDVVVGNQTFGSQVEASEINVNKEKPTGYQDGVIETEMPITITTGENVINVVYTKRTDLSYTVRYYKDSVSDINLIDSMPFINQTFGTVVSLDTVDRNLNKPYGYLDGVILNSGALVIGLSGNYIDVLYTKDDGKIVEEELFKTGDRVLNNVLNGVNYTIGYDAYIEDYVGEVTLTIVDELPYAIDVNKSNIGNGIYNSENNTITYVVNKTISENDRAISFEQNILVFYSEILESSINNKVISTLVYGDNTTNCEDEFVTEVLNGEVIVKYVDSENNELAESVKMTDLVGNDYITKAIAIEGYHLVETPDSATGKYVDGTIIVTYVYDEDGMGTDNPPHTGVSNEQYPYMSIIVLGALVLIKKFIK